MLWRRSWSLLHNQIHKALPLSSFHSVSSPKVSPFDKFVNFRWEDIDPENNFQDKHKRELTPRIVLSVLRNCVSDLIALNFFLWCAKQKNYFHDVQAFSYMVGVVENLTSRYKSVRRIVRALEDVGCVTKAQTFLLLLRIYWRGGMYEMVFEVYDEMGRFRFVPNTFACNVIMDVLFRIGRVDVAIKVLREMHCPNFLSFNIALCNLCKVNDLNNIKDVFRVMLREGFHPNPETLEMILHCFCKAGRLSEARQILCLMISLGISLSVNVWSILIGGFFQLNEPEKANDVLNKMVKTGCSPNVVTYTTLIKGFIKSGMVSHVFQILSAMKSEGLSPDLMLCNVLIGLYTKIGRYDDALEIFMKFPEQKLIPDPYTFSSLLSNICLSKRFSLFPVIADGVATEADVVVCNALLNYFCKAGYPFYAVKLYDDMVDRGLPADNYSFVSLLCGLCRTGQINEAVKVYQGLVRTQPCLDAYVHTVMVNELIKAGETHEAISLFRRAVVENYPLDVVAYTVVIRGLVRSARVREAYSLYKEMKEVGIVPNAQTYNVIISGFCEVRDVEVIEQLLQEVGRDSIELNFCTLRRVCELFSNSQPHSSAFRQLCELWGSRLTSAQVLDADVPGLELCEVQTRVLDADDDMSTGSCSSDDLLDVAASTG